MEGSEHPNMSNMVCTPTDDKTNRQSSAFMNLSASYFAVFLVAVRFNCKSVTEPCLFTNHLIQIF